MQGEVQCKVRCSAGGPQAMADANTPWALRPRADFFRFWAVSKNCRFFDGALGRPKIEKKQPWSAKGPSNQVRVSAKGKSQRLEGSQDSKKERPLDSKTATPDKGSQHGRWPGEFLMRNSYRRPSTHVGFPESYQIANKMITSWNPARISQAG